MRRRQPRAAPAPPRGRAAGRRDSAYGSGNPRRCERARHVARQQHAFLAHAGIGPRDRRQQRLRIGMRRPGRGHASRRSRPSCRDTSPPRGRDVPHHGEVVGDEQEGEAEAALQILQEVDDLGLDRDVQRRDRLVAHDQVGLDGEGAGDADALALAAGELMRIARPARAAGRRRRGARARAFALGLAVSP